MRFFACAAAPHAELGRTPGVDVAVMSVARAVRETITCYSVLIGSRNTPRAGRRFAAQDEALIQRITARHFPAGYTILASKGGWYDCDRHRFIREESRQILVTASQTKRVVAWAKALARALKQRELILVRMGEVQSVPGS